MDLGPGQDRGLEADRPAHGGQYSATINPAIRFTGRVPGDPAGTLQTEASMLEGTGSQTIGLSRWGDYTALQVDPSDDCTFWYTNQYQKVNGTFNWSSHIGSFAFPTCGAGGGRSLFLDSCFAPKLLEGSEAGKVARYSRLTPPFCLYEDRWLEVDSVLDGSPPPTSEPGRECNGDITPVMAKPMLALRKGDLVCLIFR